MLKLIVLFVVVAVAIFFGKWGISDERAVHLFAVSGYWFVAANFIGFLYFLYQSYRERIARGVSGLDWKPLLVAMAVVGSSLLFVTRSEPAGFKTVMDEHIIASTAQGLHLTRVATASMRLHYVNGRPALLNNKVDKRPIFFPYLVSVGHDLFGYHPENSIRLNVYILCPLLFILLYVLGNRLGGAWGGGVLCVLIATIPLCGFIFRGGGLELLNMVMLVASLLLGMDFLEKPTADRCGALCLAATLLAQTRYESVIFIVPVALILAAHWWRIRRITIYWPLIITPLFLVPYLWQNRVFSVSESQWQLEGQARPFGLEYLPDNLGRSIYYFFNMDATVPNSWLLAGAGLLAGIFLLLLLYRSFRERGVLFDSPHVALLLSLPAYCMLYVLLLCYSWDFGGVVVQRLCLPLYLPMALLIVVFVASLGLSHRGVRAGVVGLLFLYVVGYAFPVSSQRVYNMGVGWWEHDVIQSMFESGELDDEAIYMTENASFYSVYRYPCVSNNSANANKQAIANYIAQPGARPIYAIVRYSYAGIEAGFENENYTSLDSEFELEVEQERWLSISRKLVVSRVVGITGYEVEHGTPKTPEEYQLDCLQMLP